MTGEQVAPVEAILDDVRWGRMVVLVDDERRENERPCRHRQLDLFDDHDHNGEF